MPDKPAYAKGYSSEQTLLVRATCLHVATILGNLMDHIVIVGGLVPSLIIDQDALPDNVEPHAGTMDLDIGFEVALLEEGHYRELAKRLRDAGFEMDTKDNGNRTRQRWVLEADGPVVTVDFLIPPSRNGDESIRLRDMEPDFAAIITPGLDCAFRDRLKITLVGETPRRVKATRDVWVCGAGAFVVLKALAFDGRGANKDAYDLYYVIRNYGEGIQDVADRLQPLLDDPECPEAGRALAILERDFTDPESLGPLRAVEFVVGGRNADLQAEVSGMVLQLLERLDETG